ncbi:MAG: sulfite exporter TauE/SafE family protein, partial [Polyangiaceae bacterium]
IALHLAFVIGLVLAAAEMSGMTRRSGRRTGAPGAWSGLVAKALGRVVRAPSARTTFTLGIVWALVPCGLLYSALSMAASAGTVPGGIATMVAFGLGTTPALLGSTVVARSLTARLHARARRGAALVLVAAALVELGSLVPTGRALAGPSASARAPSHCPHHPGMH